VLKGGRRGGQEGAGEKNLLLRVVERPLKDQAGEPKKKEVEGDVFRSLFEISKGTLTSADRFKLHLVM